MNIKSEEEWAERAAAFLKHKLRECRSDLCRAGKAAQKARLQGKPRRPLPISWREGRSRRRSFWPALRPWNWTG